jgi:hypothetical protein
MQLDDFTAQVLVQELQLRLQLHHSSSSPSPPQSQMASRRLALNLQQGLRGRAGLSAKPLLRNFATPVSEPVKTSTTTLKNGLTVSAALPATVRLCPEVDADMVDRLRHNTRPMPRPRPWACGSMPDRERKPTRRMAQRISWSTLPSRYNWSEGLAQGRRHR